MIIKMKNVDVVSDGGGAGDSAVFINHGGEYGGTRRRSGKPDSGYCAVVHKTPGFSRYMNPPAVKLKACCFTLFRALLARGGDFLYPCMQR